MTTDSLMPVADATLHWSVCVRDIATGRDVWEDAPSLVLPSASLGKLLLLVAVHDAVTAGTMDATELLSRGDERVGDSGLWYTLDVEALSVDDCCRLVSAVSDNLATNVLLDRVGLGAVAEAGIRHRVRDVALHDRVREHRDARHPATLSSGSARGYVDLAEIVEGRSHLRTMLASNTDLSMTASAYGLDPLAHALPDRGISLWNKTGTDRGIRADVGVIRGPEAALAYAVMAVWDADSEDARSAALSGHHAWGMRIARHVGAVGTTTEAGVQDD